MGMFTWVKPANEILPEQFRNLDGWQTKDVVEQQLNTLEITADGKLVHIWFDKEWVDDPNAFLGGYFRPTTEHRDTLDYHGDMYFYTFDSSETFIELKARFTEGQLQWVNLIEKSKA